MTRINLVPPQGLSVQAMAAAALCGALAKENKRG